MVKFITTRAKSSQSTYHTIVCGFRCQRSHNVCVLSVSIYASTAPSNCIRLEYWSNTIHSYVLRQLSMSLSFRRTCDQAPIQARASQQAATVEMVSALYRSELDSAVPQLDVARRQQLLARRDRYRPLSWSNAKLRRCGVASRFVPSEKREPLFDNDSFVGSRLEQSNE